MRFESKHKIKCGNELLNRISLLSNEYVSKAYDANLGKIGDTLEILYKPEVPVPLDNDTSIYSITFRIIITSKGISVYPEPSILADNSVFVVTIKDDQGNLLSIDYGVSDLEKLIENSKIVENFNNACHKFLEDKSIVYKWIDQIYPLYDKNIPITLITSIKSEDIPEFMSDYKYTMKITTKNLDTKPPHIMASVTISSEFSPLVYNDIYILEVK
jgi:hypothetical protein